MTYVYARGVAFRRLAGMEQCSLRKLQDLLDDAGVDRKRLTGKKQLMVKAREVMAARLCASWMAAAGTGATWTCEQ